MVSRISWENLFGIERRVVEMLISRLMMAPRCLGMSVFSNLKGFLQRELRTKELSHIFI